MKKYYTAVLFLFIFLPINLNLLAPKTVQAATSDTSVIIQPSQIEITASPDQKLARKFSIINRSNFYVKLKLIVKDYKQVSNTGKIQFYDAKMEPASSWLIPQYLEIGLKPLETRDVGLVVSVPKDFSGGGHYGAILFQSADNSSNVNTADFGELVLMTVTGSGIKTTAIIKSFSLWTAGMFQQGNPVDFNFKMQNSGNTHFDAQGKLVLQDWLGKTIGSYNVGQLTVYPGTNRLFVWRWNGTPSFGIYKASVLLSDPSLNNQFRTVDGLWFVIFPWTAALSILLLVAVIFMVVKLRKKILSRLPVRIPVRSVRVMDK